MALPDDRRSIERWRDGTLTLHDKFLLSIVRVAERLKREQGAIFKSYGITFPQYNVLRVLCTYEGGKATTTNVCRKMLVSGPNLSALLKRLEKRGFVKRERDPNDERVILLEITPKGTNVLANIEEEKEENLNKFFSDIPEEENRHITRTLVKILNKP